MVTEVYTGILIAVFVLIGWFAFYAVYKLFSGQR